MIWPRASKLENRMPIRGGRVRQLRRRAGDLEPGAARTVPCRNLGVGIVARLSQPDVIGVRIEHDEPEPGLSHDLLQQHSRRVGLARARLSAEEGVSSESFRVEAGMNLGRMDERADVQAVGIETRLPPTSATASAGAGAIGASLKPWTAAPSTVAKPSSRRTRRPPSSRVASLPSVICASTGGSVATTANPPGVSGVPSGASKAMLRPSADAATASICREPAGFRRRPGACSASGRR